MAGDNHPESHWQILPEPYKIKSVERIVLLPHQVRQERLAAAGYNPFMLSAQDVFIDLLTDSGTGAMSTAQWAALMMGDESYAGSHSWYQLKQTIYELTGAKHIFPVHQGRAGENILFSIIGGKERVFISNGHFDTTRANIEWSGAQAIDLPAGNKTPAPFGGSLDIDHTRTLLTQLHNRAAGIILTLTNNTYAGQPVSMDNIVAARKLCDEFRLPLIMDIARIAENSYFIHKYQLPEHTPWQIAQEICRMADIILMSAKKDGLVNMGGFVCINDAQLAEHFAQQLIIKEGFLHYGGHWRGARSGCLPLVCLHRGQRRAKGLLPFLRAGPQLLYGCRNIHWYLPASDRQCAVPSLDGTEACGEVTQKARLVFNYKSLTEWFALLDNMLCGGYHPFQMTDGVSAPGYCQPDKLPLCLVAEGKTAQLTAAHSPFKVKLARKHLSGEALRGDVFV